MAEGRVLVPGGEEGLRRWLAAQPPLRWEELSPQETAVLVVDMLVGFAREGPLASPRVDALTWPIRRFLAQARRHGVTRVWRLEDAHTPDAGEFAVYPPHCLEGSREAEPLPELLEEPLFAQAVRIPKNALSAFSTLDLEEALFAQGVRTAILVGDCTDLCILHNAMPLRLYANARRHALEVVVPAHLVDTYDSPDHPGDLSHLWALYHMAQNGVRVLRGTEEET